MNSFSVTGLHDGILKAVQELGFVEPTPIQAETIPHLLSSDQDVIALAQTGTGKTAAFGLPAIHLTNTDDKHTQTIILCPTRELCMQISKDIKNYAKYTKNLGVVPVYGGASIEPQITALKKNAQIVVGTPGRVKDLIKRKKLLLGKIERVILDEADEMLSMGFKDDLDSILAATPVEKQTLLFSATMPKEVLRITKTYMDHPVELSVSRENLTTKNVKHVYYMVQAKDRYEVLKRLADINPSIYGIVFCRTRRETKEIAAKFMNDGYNADALHGDLSQAQRDEVMGRFRSGHLQLLIATDVAARGLDVNNLTHIINFNLPDDPEVYVHRSGRTGRAGKTGTSILIAHSREHKKIREIEHKFEIKFTKERVPSGKDICSKQLYALIDKIEKVEVDEKQIEPFLDPIYKKLEWLSREELIKHFVSAEFNRFLAYYKNATDINISDKPKRERDERRSEEGRRGRRSNMSRLFINVGSRDKLNPTRLIGLINESLDSNDAEVGKIEIMRNFSFFEIDEKVAPKLMKAAKDQEFEGTQVSIEQSQSKDSAESSGRKRSSGKSRSYSGGKRDSRRSGRDRRTGERSNKKRRRN